MLVKILEFGSNWWTRFGFETTDPWRFTRHACYYNSTGVRCGSKMRRHWIIPGLIRFNGTGDFNPHFPLRALGKIFLCSPLAEDSSGNRLFVGKRANSGRADYFLAVIAADRHGSVDFTAPRCKSATVLPIAVSALRERQEALVLIQPGDWVRSSIGIWQLVVEPKFPHGASLRLQEGPTARS